MKTRSLLYRFPFCAACALLIQPVLGMGQTAEAQYGDTANASIVERGPHHRIWEKVWYEQGPSGEAVERRSRVTEIASGLHFWNPATREWKESIEEFHVTQDGYAVATNGQHKVIISPVLNDAGGAVDLLTPDGQRLRSTIMALNIHNRATGQSVLVAEVATNSVGYLVSPNEIVFSNAFDGFAADVRFVFKKGEFHQDVIVREAIDFELLRVAGFPAEDSEWEIWTEFFEAPEPRIESRIARSELNTSRRVLMVEPDLLDEDLDFGAMKMPVGAAYLRTGRGETRKEINVFKRWLKIEGGNYLLEAMPLDSLQPLFSALGSGALNSNPLEGKKMYAGRRAPSPALRRPQAETILAGKSPIKQEFDGGVQLVMDYVTVNGSYYDYVFRGGEWYRVSGPVYLYTTGGNKTIVEGNTVVKFAKNASAKLVFWPCRVPYQSLQAGGFHRLR